MDMEIFRSIKERYEYRDADLVGKGTYGKVYKAKDKRTGQIVALKKVLPHHEESTEGISPTTIREISLLQMLSRDNAYIVRLLNVHFVQKKKKTRLFLVFEYFEYDLRKFIENFRQKKMQIPSTMIKGIMYQLFKGVAYLHSHGVMHRDLKPHNILISRDCKLKLADLGLGRAFVIPIKQYSQEIVTLWYKAPEMLLGDPYYSLSLDMWSIGCIFGELCKLCPPFTGDSELQQLLFIFKVLGTPNDQVWPKVTKLPNWHVYPQWKRLDLSKYFENIDCDGLDLLSKLLVYEPSKRISAKEALCHPYFNDLDKEMWS